MKKTQKVLQILIILLGCSGAFALFSNNLVLLSALQNSGTVPVPLVFDAPRGYEFWSNNNSYTLQTNQEKFDNLIFNKEVYNRFPRHSILHNSVLIPLAMFPLFPENFNQNIGKKIFCDSSSWQYFMPRKLNEHEKIIYFEIIISNKENQWNMRVQCL